MLPGFQASIQSLAFPSIALLAVDAHPPSLVYPESQGCREDIRHLVSLWRPGRHAREGTEDEAGEQE